LSAYRAKLGNERGSSGIAVREREHSVAVAFPNEKSDVARLRKRQIPLFQRKATSPAVF
jgi:hypothetical protein